MRLEAVGQTGNEQAGHKTGKRVQQFHGADLFGRGAGIVLEEGASEPVAWVWEGAGKAQLQLVLVGDEKFNV